MFDVNNKTRTTNVTLSVIIPTYNGALHIKDTLESVFRQVVNREDVEFIIRDNASTDNTGEIIKELNNQYNNKAIYDRRPELAIADVNYTEAISLAKGSHILLLGDDDLLFPNCIARVLELINMYPAAGLIYLNRISTTRDYEGANLKHHNPSPIFCHEYNGVIDFINDYPSGPDFMSVNIVKKECWYQGRDFAKSIYYGVEWYSVILAGLQNYTIAASFEPLILQRVPKKRVWNDLSLLYVIGGMSRMFLDLDKIYPGIYKIWNNYSLKYVTRINFIISSIHLNRNLYKEKKNDIIPFLTKSEKLLFRTLIALPFIELPVRIINFIYNKIRMLLR